MTFEETGRKSVYIDWRSTLLEDFEPEDQKNTSTCWAFAIALCVSLLAVLEHGVLDDGIWRLSVQELVDRVCQTYRREDLQPSKFPNFPLFKQDAFYTYGSLTQYGFLYCKNYGLSYAHHYPFVGRRNLGKSMPAEDELPRVYISDFDLLPGSASKNMNTILGFLAKQPLVGKLYATKEFQNSHFHYLGSDSGIEHLTETEHGVIATEAHSVVIVGYIGTIDCFIVLNSWGKSFGDKGYLLVASKLMFDVGRPKVSFKVNRKVKYQTTKLPRKCFERVITSASSTPSEVVTDLVLQKVRDKREIVFKANGLRMSKTVFIAENFKVFLKKTLADVILGCEEVVVTFQGIDMLTFSERYNVEARTSLLNLQGQANDFQIQFSSFVSLGSLPKTWSVPDLRPLHKLFRTFAQSLQHIREIALEASREIQCTGGRKPAFLRALSQRLCRGFNDAVNGLVSKEVADDAVDAYFAAFLKASLCTTTYVRPGGFSATTVILLLAYTVIREKFFKVLQLEGHAFSPENMALSRFVYLLQLCSGLDDNAGGGCAQFVFAPTDKTCAVDVLLLPSVFCVIPLDLN